MVNRLIKSNVTQLIKDMEEVNVVSFGLNPMEQFEIDGENFFGRPFSSYNCEIILNGEKVCLNPLCYGGDLPTIETKETWLFFNFEKAILYDNNTKEFLGEIKELIR